MGMVCAVQALQTQRWGSEGRRQCNVIKGDVDIIIRHRESNIEPEISRVQVSFIMRFSDTIQLVL